MEHIIVEYTDGKFNFPECFARKRGKKDFIDKFIFGCGCVSLGAGSLLTTKPIFEFLLNTSTYSNLFFIIWELLSRTISFREEYSHIESLYKNSLFILIKKLFKPNFKTIVFMFYIAIVHGYSMTFSQFFEYITSTIEDFKAGILVLGGCKFLTDIIELDESPVKVSKMIDRIPGLSYGSGMAINYFYGYLNLVLPGLRERIGDFSSRHNVEFASIKLFILMPLSGKCPQDVADYSPRGILEQSEITEPIELNRGGVRRRNYHNTCYKLNTRVNNNKKYLYICCEFASAFQTFHEVRQHHHSVTEFFKEYEKEIVTDFYMTLQKLIEEKDYGNYCELIFFKDRDENGRLLYEDRLDIGDLLLKRLNLPQ